MSLIVDASVAVKWVVEEPGSDKALFLSWLKKQLADETISIKETLYFPTLESPVDSELMRAQRVLKHYDKQLFLITGSPRKERSHASTTIFYLGYHIGHRPRPAECLRVCTGKITDQHAGAISCTECLGSGRTQLPHRQCRHEER